MSVLLDILKEVVTPENVNRIPDYFIEADGFENILYVCKQAGYGFIQLAVFLNSVECVNWLLSNFVSCIDFERITLPERFVLFLNNLDNNFQDEHCCFVPLLVWCAKHSPRMFLMFLQAGIQSGAEKAFEYVAKTGSITSLPVLECMLQKGIGINYILPPLYARTTKLIQKYKSRRDRCKAVVVRLLGLLRFKKTKYFCGLDPRLLKQMVVTPVWETRYSECWDSIEVKKLKI